MKKYILIGLVLLCSSVFASYSKVGGIQLGDIETITATNNATVSVKKSVTWFNCTEAATATLSTSNAIAGQIKIVAVPNLTTALTLNVGYVGGTSIKFDADGEGAIFMYDNVRKKWLLIGKNY